GRRSSFARLQRDRLRLHASGDARIVRARLFWSTLRGRGGNDVGAGRQTAKIVLTEIVGDGRRSDHADDNATSSYDPQRRHGRWFEGIAEFIGDASRDGRAAGHLQLGVLKHAARTEIDRNRWKVGSTLPETRGGVAGFAGKDGI